MGWELMTEAKDGKAIKVNRAPVLTLWAAVVAERLGHDRDAAITLGRAVAGSARWWPRPASPSGWPTAIAI